MSVVKNIKGIPVKVENKILKASDPGKIDEGRIIRRFNHSLFECGKSPFLCCAVVCCSCCIASNSLTDVNGSDCIENCLCFFCKCVACRLRVGARKMYKINSNYSQDILSATCCFFCSIVQIEHQIQYETANQKLSMNQGPNLQGGIIVIPSNNMNCNNGQSPPAPKIEMMNI